MTADQGTLTGIPPGSRRPGRTQGAPAADRDDATIAADAVREVMTAKAGVPRTPAWLYVVGALLAVTLVWRIVAVNLSAQFTEIAIDEGVDAQPAATSAIAWDRDNAVALARDAALKMDTDPAGAEALAQRALRANPATAPAWLVLAGLAQKRGDNSASITYLKRAAEIEPQNPTTRLALANLALEQRDLGAALEDIDAAIRARPELGESLFPKMLAILAQPGGDAALRKLFARRIPDWWSTFFTYASTNAPTPLLPLQLLDARRAFAPPVSLKERSPIVDRLAKSGEWNAAFVVWLNGLSAEQRRAAGNVYNGAFEEPFTNTTFDWQWPRGNGADIAALSTFGTGGGRALRVAFQGQVRDPRLVTQTLLLEPGYHYDLRGRYRLESVRTQFGVEWQVTCGAASAGDRSPLVAGDRLVGSSDWKDFSTTFTVPADCYPQQLTLMLIGDAKLDLQASGLAWYDEIQVVRGSSVIAESAAPAIVKRASHNAKSKAK
ncbi:MAG: carbohydrate binding domain-containing protein [Proteobacteria bacterium]|nr:carbohydrate binding domain-containing protein [Pseudomonadota bacterium]